MKTSIVLISFLALFLGGCASQQAVVTEVKEAKGQGVTRVYQSSLKTVHDATLAAAKAHSLDVVEDDKANRTLILSHSVTAMSWGEEIAVFFTPVGTKSTQVEIVSKPLMSTLNFPPDWPKILEDQIAVELQTKK